MSKTVVIKRFGNAKAIILPEDMLEELELERGSKVTLTLVNKQLVLTPIREKNVTLESLMKPCSKPQKKARSE